MVGDRQKKQKTRERARNPQVGSTVFVGGKPIMNCVVACLTYFNSGAKKVVIKARGRTICRAVDAVELLRRTFLKDLRLQEISTSTQKVVRENGQEVNVSAIEITLTKPYSLLFINVFEEARPSLCSLLF